MPEKNNTEEERHGPRAAPAPRPPKHAPERAPKIERGGRRKDEGGGESSEAHTEKDIAAHT